MVWDVRESIMHFFGWGAVLKKKEKSLRLIGTLLTLVTHALPPDLYCIILGLLYLYITCAHTHTHTETQKHTVSKFLQCVSCSTISQLSQNVIIFAPSLLSHTFRINQFSGRQISYCDLPANLHQARCFGLCVFMSMC